MPQKQALQESIKKEVLADLKRESPYQASPAVISAIKDDVLAEIEREQRSATYSRRLTTGERELIKQNVLRELSGDDYNLRGAVDKTVVENIKNELLAELSGPSYGTGDNWRNVLSQRSIDRRINQQYSSLRNLRGEIRRGLEIARDTEQRLNNIKDPYVRDAVHSIIQEARYEGIPLDSVISRLNAGDGGLGQRMGGWLSSDTAKGFLGGIGASFLISLLFPAARSSLRNMGIRMMEGTLDLADQTRSTFGRAREGFEDMIAEANFNNLQENEEFSQAAEQQTSTEEPLDDNPLH